MKALIEVEVLRQLDHPYCTKMYDCFVDVDHLWMVLELCEGGELLGLIKMHTKKKQPVPEEIIKKFLL